MATTRDDRPAILSPALVEVLGEFLAFRHLFRGASIALMRWEKLSPLIARVDVTHAQAKQQIEDFIRFLERTDQSV
jgi:hypothetical protein